MSSSVAIATVSSEEILDSRGYPTLRTTVALADGTSASAAVPSGTSTGQYEAVELRDRDASRYAGHGVLQAVANVNGPIAQALVGLEPDDQWRIDATLTAIDGTEFKSRFGANAILSASLACAKAAAMACGLPLFQYLGGDAAHVIPVPMLNILNGGQHAHDGPDVQEFMVVPHGAPTFREALRYAVETCHALREVLQDANLSVNTGGQGGFAPHLTSNDTALDMLMIAIERAGYLPGDEISIALDFAASSLHSGERYRLDREGISLSTAEMVDYVGVWLRHYPIISIEDPLADSDWSGFGALTAAYGDDVQIVGDDLFVSNRMFLVRGVAQRCCNAVLIKPNQVGTVTETLDTARMAREAGLRRWFPIVPATPRTQASRTSRLRSTAGRPSRGRRRTESGSPSTTGCSRSKRNWARRLCTQDDARSDI
jgi:enolase